ncbi:hypothetical protein ES705_19243 [subsurface metagenome]
MSCAYKHLKKYTKDSKYSYTLGVYPTIELLKAKPELVLYIIADSKFSLSDGYEKIEKYCKRYTITYKCNDRLINRLSPKGNCYLIGLFKEKMPCDTIGVNIIIYDNYNKQYSKIIKIPFKSSEPSEKKISEKFENNSTSSAECW